MKENQYVIDIIDARHERAERRLWAVIAALLAAIVLLALRRRE